MSVAVCRSSAASSAALTGFESILALPAAAAFAAPLCSPCWPAQQAPLQEGENYVNYDDNGDDDDDRVSEENRPPGQFDIWTSIQAQKEAQQKDEKIEKEQPYVHPLVRRSSSGLLTQKSLEICTESLGSETGSDEFFSSDDDDYSDFFSSKHQRFNQQDAVIENDDDDDEEAEEEEELEEEKIVIARKELTTVNYHCSISRRSSLPRSFPPPLPSISRRDGPCLQMRPHRRDGRLVVEAVPVPSQNYLHAQRHNGRLLLSFINSTSSFPNAAANNNVGTIAELNHLQQEDHVIDVVEEEDQEEEEEEAEEEEEEVEVVDRGTVVEVKVSTQPPQQSNATAPSKKVHRSSIVINKFVSMPLSCDIREIAAAPSEPAVRPVSPARKLPATAAAVAASSLSSSSAAAGGHSSPVDNHKLLFTSRRRNREELLHDMRRCSQLRKPLFIWEPCCIATSS